MDRFNEYSSAGSGYNRSHCLSVVQYKEPFIAALVDETQTTTSGQVPCVKISHGDKSLSWIGCQNSLLPEAVKFNGIYRSNKDSFSFHENQYMFEQTVRPRVAEALEGGQTEILICGSREIARPIILGPRGLVIQCIKFLLLWSSEDSHSRKILVTYSTLDEKGWHQDKGSQCIGSIQDMEVLLTTVFRISGVESKHILFSISPNEAGNENHGQLRFFMAASMLSREAANDSCAPMTWYTRFLQNLAVLENTDEFRCSDSELSPIAFTLQDALDDKVGLSVLCVIDSASCYSDETLNSLVLVSRFRYLLRRGSKYVWDSVSANILSSTSPIHSGLSIDQSPLSESNETESEQLYFDDFKNENARRPNLEENDRYQAIMENEIERLQSALRVSQSSKQELIEKLDRKTRQCVNLKATNTKHERMSSIAKQRLANALEKNQRLSKDIENLQTELTTAGKRILALKGKRKDHLKTLCQSSEKQKEEMLQLKLMATSARRTAEEEKLRNCRLASELEGSEKNLNEARRQRDVEKQRIKYLQREICALSRESKAKALNQTIAQLNAAVADYKRRWLAAQATCRQLQTKLTVRHRVKSKTSDRQGFHVSIGSTDGLGVSEMIRGLLEQQYGQRDTKRALDLGPQPECMSVDDVRLDDLTTSREDLLSPVASKFDHKLCDWRLDHKL